MNQVGLVGNQGFALPLTQEQLSDTMGLTPIHVNRTFQKLWTDGLLSLAGRQLTIHDLGRLRQAAGFNPNYLHLDRR